MLALATARGRGIAVDGDVVAKQLEHVADFLARNTDQFLKGEGTAGRVDNSGYALLMLEVGGGKRDAATDAVVEYLLGCQTDGHWRTYGDRPPSEASHFPPNYLAARALRVWASPAQRNRANARLASARSWLLREQPKDTEDRVFRLLALKEVGAADKEVRAAAESLAKTQRRDGGWGQLDSMPSDAYATGTALVALHTAGGWATDDPAYRRGLGYLVRTQLKDGTWWVRSRSKPFQKYYEGGFPHGKDQFISAAASGWAATALALACPPAATAAR
jgi:hypothetical protein